MKQIRFLIGAAMALAAAMILTTAGALERSPNESEGDAVYSALVGAQEVVLSMGGYESPECSTGVLSEADLQGQIDDYNNCLDHYLTTDNTLYSLYQTQNEYLLREVFTEETTYRVDGGVLSCNVETMTFDETGTTAIVDATIVDYNKWVDVSEDGAYAITCAAGSTDVVAKLQKADGTWKLQEYIEFTVGDSWSPSDIPQTYSLTSDESSAASVAAQAAEAEYATFDGALLAAEAIDVESLCPLGA